MSVVCSMCGRLTQDPEFCDHCNADLGKAGQSLPPERCPLGSDGAMLALEQRHALLFPESSVLLPAEGRRWRVHWISDHDWRERGQQLEKRLSLQIPGLPAGRLVDDLRGRWLAFETAEGGTPAWQQAPLSEPLPELHRLSACVHSLALSLELLHHHSFLWLNFDPNALEDAGPLNTPSETAASADCRSLRITNLDVELFPFQSMPDRVRVHPHYAAPEVV